MRECQVKKEVPIPVPWRAPVRQWCDLRQVEVTDPIHPAKFSPSVIEAMEVIVRQEAKDKPKRLRRLRVLDPFAGVGRIHQLPCVTVGVELEPEWANMHPDTIVGDATALPFRKNHFDVIATSPVYGNRFSDHHNAKDGSKRRSYTHDLGRKLSPGNAGVMEFRNDQSEFAPYRVLHRKAWVEAVRVLRPGGLLVLNCSNFYAKKTEQTVAGWHAMALRDLGFIPCGVLTVGTPRMTMGANRDRVEGEYVMSFRLPA